MICGGKNSELAGTSGCRCEVTEAPPGGCGCTRTMRWPWPGPPSPSRAASTVGGLLNDVTDCCSAGAANLTPPPPGTTCVQCAVYSHASKGDVRQMTKSADFNCRHLIFAWLHNCIFASSASKNLGGQHPLGAEIWSSENCALRGYDFTSKSTRSLDQTSPYLFCLMQEESPYTEWLSDFEYLHPFRRYSLPNFEVVRNLAQFCMFLAPEIFLGCTPQNFGPAL